MQAGNSTEDARSVNDSSFGRNFEANLVLCNFVGCNCVTVSVSAAKWPLSTKRRYRGAGRFGGRRPQRRTATEDGGSCVSACDTRSSFCKNPRAIRIAVVGDTWWIPKRIRNVVRRKKRTGRHLFKAAAKWCLNLNVLKGGRKGERDEAKSPENLENTRESLEETMLITGTQIAANLLNVAK